MPHELGAGLRLWEQCNQRTVGTALLLLLACSNGRGGGDFHDDGEDGEGIDPASLARIGSWADALPWCRS